ncbi:MAG: glycosyltransferase family 4 protein [Chloroflexi bacterium]|nr:glycosyltransferase family 4 protein [Chloroflexota bacterium]
MKIACITTSQIPSSTANSIQAMKVCHALKQNGADVRLWVPKFRTASWDELADLYGLQIEFPVEWLSFRKALKQYDFCWKAVEEAKKWVAEVLYTWALQSAVFAQRRMFTSVMEFHDFPMGRIGPLLFKQYIQHQQNTLSLTTTRALADGLEERYGFKFRQGSLQIAPNGTDPQRYQHLPDPTGARRQLGLEENITVGFTGHFYRGRGVDLLLEIAIRLPQVNFLWVGGKEEHVRPWREELKTRNITNVTLTGFITNQQLPLYQAACDILVMPYGKKISGSSGGDIAKVINPMKMFDYMASGRAIVASEIPVFHEVLSEQTTLFCPPDDSQAWALAIRRLVENEQLRNSLAHHARQLSQQYSWVARAGRSLALIRNMEGTSYEERDHSHS